MTHHIQAIRVNGTRIEYTDTGTGPALLLIHAGGFSDWFLPLADHPALQGFRVIRMIRAGYPAGAAPVGPLSLADHAAHCATLLETLGIDHADVLAHSSGVVIALQLVLDRPELVDSLILLEPPLIDTFAAPEDLELLRNTLGPAIGKAVGAAHGGDLPAAFDSFMAAVCGPEYRKVVENALGTDGLARAENNCRYFFTGEMPTFGQWRFDEQHAAGIVQPVLLVQGGASPPPVHRLVARLAAMMPNTEIVTVDGENHLLPLSNPAALADVVTAFARRANLAQVTRG